MTNEDYRTFYKSLMARFPSVHQWWERLPEETRRVQSEDWRDALQRESLADSESALKMIKQGNAEAWPEFNREMIGAHVARIARGIRVERESRAEGKPTLEGSRVRKRGRVQVKSMYARIIELKEQGVPQEEAARRVREEFATNSTDGPRYDCPDCLNFGTVEVWHPDTITRIMQGDDVRSKYVVHVPCQCSRGDRFITPENGKQSDQRTYKPGTERYSNKRHCLVTNSSLPPSEVEIIKDWVQAIRPYAEKQQPGEWQFT